MADKTTNFYKLEPSTYKALLEQNITKSYKKTDSTTAQATHTENKNIAGCYAQFLSGLNTGHLYHPTQVLIPLKNHFKMTCCQLTGRSLRYPICRWNKYGCVWLFLPANAPVAIDLTIAVDVESNPGPVRYTWAKTTQCRTT